MFSEQGNGDSAKSYDSPKVTQLMKHWSPLEWLESTLGLPNTVLYCPMANNQKKFKFMERLLQSYVNLFNPPSNPLKQIHPSNKNRVTDIENRLGAMAPHSSTLAWKIPWIEEPGRLQSMGLQRVGHNSVTSLSLCTFMHWRRKWQPTPVFLPGESQGLGTLVG